MEPSGARRDLDFIRQVMERTHRRVDPHAFHCVHWGAIVLVWFPLATYFERIGHPRWQLPLALGALVLGFALSAGREMWLRVHPRMPGENTFVSRQMVLIVYPTIFAGSALSGLGPSFDLIAPSNIPIIWGLIYANMAFMMGVVYTREFLYSGVFIFAGVVLAIIFQPYNGYILGPFMGLGMIVPGLMAERRVRRLVAADGVGTTASV